MSPSLSRTEIATEILPLSDDGIEFAQGFRARRRLPTSTPGNTLFERSALLLPLGLLAACGGGGGGTPNPPPPPPAPSITTANDTAAVTAALSTSPAAQVTGNVLTNDTPASGPTVTAVGVGTTAGSNLNPAVGTLGTLTVTSNGGFTFVANQAGSVALGAGQTGTNTFTYTATNSGSNANGTLTVTVTGVNDAPTTSGPASATVAPNATAGFGGTLGAADSDTGDSITVRVTAIPGNGTQVLNGSTPVAVNDVLTVAQLGALQIRGGGIGTTPGSFTYSVTDAAGLSVNKTVTINLSAAVQTANDSATVTAAVSGNPAAQVTGNVLTNDIPATGTTVTAIGVGSTAGTNLNPAVGTLGTLTVTSNGGFTFAADQAGAVALGAGATGNNIFTYTAANGGATGNGTLTVTVTGVNDAPTTSGPGSVNLAPNATGGFGGTLGAADPDSGDTITIRVTAIPTGAGAAVLNGSTAVTVNQVLTVAQLNALTVQVGAAGTTPGSFTYSVTDAAGLVTSKTVTIGIATGVNLAGLSGTTGAVLTGASGSGFGTAIGGGGDVNGDGRPDLLVGSPNTGNGSVALYLGTASGQIATTASQTLNGLSAGDRFGQSISVSTVSIGGSAAADILIGAPGAAPNGVNSGRAFIIFGQGTLAVPDPAGFGTTNGFVFNGTESGTAYNGTTTAGVNNGTNAGYIVAAVGDVNNDGRGDYVVSAPGQEGTAPLPANNNSGAAFIGYGTATPSLNVDGGTFGGAFVRGGTTQEAVASAVASSASGTASFNGANGSDLAIGAANRNDGGADRGYVYVLIDQSSTGGINLSNFNGTNGFAIKGAAVGDLLGASIAFGDVDGDGRADLIIGAPGADVNGTDSGAVYVVFGGTATGANIDLSATTFTNGVASVNGLTVARIGGAAANAGFGNSVAFIGNFDGTSGDFAVGTRGGSGDAFVINGGSSTAIGARNVAVADGTNVQLLDGPSGTGNAVIVSGIGNVNGTGGDDLGVGIANINTAYVVYGKNAQGSTGFVMAADEGSTDAIINHFAGNDSSAQAAANGGPAGLMLAAPLMAHDPIGYHLA